MERCLILHGTKLCQLLASRSVYKWRVQPYDSDLKERFLPFVCSSIYLFIYLVCHPHLSFFSSYFFCYPHFFPFAFSHPHPPSAGIRSAFYRHPTISPFFLVQAPPLLRLLPRGQLLRLLLRLLLLALPLPILLHQLRQHRQGKVAFNIIPLLDHHLRDMSIIWRTKDTQWKSLVESTIKHLMESLWSWRAAHSTRYMSRTPMPIVRMRTYIKPYISIL